MKNSTLCLLSALGGAIVGATVAVLVTPQSGKELRVKIHNAIDERAARIREELCRRNNPGEPDEQ